MESSGRAGFQDAGPEALAALLSAGLAAYGEAGREGETTGERSVPASGAFPHITGYEVIHEVYHGGQGVVYEALQKSTKRSVAVKLLLQGHLAPPVARKRFEREIELVAQLRHPNIIAVFDSGTTTEGLRYCVMDYVRGRPLHRYVREEGLDVDDTLRLFTTICDAVQYAHLHGVIHRDLKPSNILVDSDGRPRILDFGLAKTVSGSDETRVSISQEVLGTLPYMSPEQARGHSGEIDVRSDVYALGVVLYELLTGGYPYEVAGALPDVLRNITESPPIPPTRKWSPAAGVRCSATRRIRTSVCPINGDVQRIVLKALEKEPDRRYQNAGELAGDLRRYLAGEPIEARQDSHWYLLRKTIRRHRVGVTAGGVVLIAVVAALAVSILFWHSAAEERDRLRQINYFRQIGVAQAAYNNNQMARMKELLITCPPDLRGWEWGHLNWSSDRSLRTFHGHDGGFRSALFAGVRSAVFSKDGRTIVSGGQDKTVRIWELGEEQEVKLLETLEGHDDAVLSDDLSTDGTRIASGGRDGTLRVWDALTGAQVFLHQAAHEGEVRSVDFSGDGHRIASGGSDGKVKVWDAATGTILTTIDAHEERVWAVAFDPQGRRIASASKDATIRLWDAMSGAYVQTLTGHRGPVQAIAFTCDGRRLVSGSEDQTVILWDVAAGAINRTMTGHKGPVGAVAFSPDGQWIISGAADRLIKVWNADSGAEFRTLCGHDFPPTSLCFSPDGGRILSASEDYTLKLWDFKPAERELSTDGIAGAKWPAAFSPDGGSVVSAAGNGTLKVWNAMTGVEWRTLGGHEDRITSLAFSPDGQLVATASYDGTVRLWEFATGTSVRTIRGHNGWVTAVDFSPNGHRLLSGGADGTLRVWTVATGQQEMLLDGHARGVLAVFTPDGSRLVAGDADGMLRIWDVGDGHCARAWRGHHTDAGLECSVLSIAVAPDGRTFASGGGDNRVRVWNLRTGEPVWTLEGHEYDVRGVAFAPDGTRLASSSADGTVRIWDPAARQEAIVLSITTGAGNGVAFSPNGRRLISDRHPDSLVVWESEPGD